MCIFVTIKLIRIDDKKISAITARLLKVMGMLLYPLVKFICICPLFKLICLLKFNQNYFCDSTHVQIIYQVGVF